MRKIIVGDIYKSNTSGRFRVVEYNSWKDVVIIFEDTAYSVSCSVGAIRSGTVKDKLFPRVYGVGFLGDGVYKSNSRGSGREASGYCCWNNMLKRCYDERYQEKHPTYKVCKVHKDWHNFQNFAKWFEENYKEGFHLDKDLLYKGNKEYGPDTCIFVPSQINTFTLGHSNARGKYKIGVSRKGSVNAPRPYRAKINDNYGKIINLGYFPTEEQAYQVWLKAKLQQALEYKPEMDEIDLRIYPNVVEIIKEM